MVELRVFVAFAALCVLALCFYSAGIKSAFAPFCAVCAAVLWFSAFAMAGGLVLGGWLFYLACAAGLCWLLWRHIKQKKALAAPGFGFWFFVVAGLCVLLLLYIKKPLFLYWDEFSFWGTASKATKLYGELYTTTEIGWPGQTTQKPGLVALSYFFQFLGPGFVEWQVYAAYDIFMLAALATPLACFKDKKQWNIALPAMLVLALVPFAFRHGISIDYITNVYLDSTAELPLGLCFGAALAAWFGATRGGKNMVPVCLFLAALVLIKDTAFTFALVAVVLMLLDSLLCGGKKRPLKQRLARAGIYGGLALAAVLVVFVGWEAYASAISGVSRLDSVSSSHSAGMLQLPGLFLQDLFRAEKGELFTQVTGGMVEYFFARGNMFGSGFTTVLLIAALVFFSAILAGREGLLRRRCIVFGIFSVLGFAAYYLFITLCYLYIFSPVEARMLASYDRYIYPFYMGWFMAALVLFFLAVSQAKPRMAAVCKGGVVLLGLGLLLRTNQLVPVNYTLLGVQPEDYNERREFTAHCEEVSALLAPDGKTFLVLSEDGGLGIFKYVYEMLPLRIDYSYGGGSELREKRPTADGGSEAVEITVQELEQHLIESGCTTVYIDTATEYFKQMYGTLFLDDMHGYENGETRLYAVEVEGDTARLRPLPMENFG